MRRFRRQHHRDNLCFVAEPFREQRPHRTVNQAAGQNFLLRRTPFPLYKPARILPGSVGVLAVIYRQRKKIRPRFRIIIRARRYQNDRLARSHDNRTIRLLRDLAGLNRDL